MLANVLQSIGNIICLRYIVQIFCSAFACMKNIPLSVKPINSIEETINKFDFFSFCYFPGDQVVALKNSISLSHLDTSNTNVINATSDQVRYIFKCVLDFISVKDSNDHSTI